MSYIIKVKCNKEEDLYNEYDPDMFTLKDSLINYLYTKVEEAGKNDTIVVEVYTDDTIDKKKLDNAFDTYFQSEINDSLKELNTNIIKELVLLIIGVIFLVVYLIIGKESLLYEMVSIIASFAIWTSLELFLFENGKTKERLKKYRQLLASKQVYK